MFGISTEVFTKVIVRAGMQEVRDYRNIQKDVCLYLNSIATCFLRTNTFRYQNSVILPLCHIFKCDILTECSFARQVNGTFQKMHPVSFFFFYSLCDSLLFCVYEYNYCTSVFIYIHQKQLCFNSTTTTALVHIITLMFGYFFGQH